MAVGGRGGVARQRVVVGSGERWVEYLDLWLCAVELGAGYSSEEWRWNERSEGGGEVGSRDRGVRVEEWRARSPEWCSGWSATCILWEFGFI